MAELEKEIAAFDAIRGALESEHFGKWALVYGRDLIGTYDSFDAAATYAVSKFGRGPYLIREIGSPPVIIPASAMFVFRHA